MTKRMLRFFLLASFMVMFSFSAWAQASNQAGKVSLDLEKWIADNKILIRTVNNGSWSNDPRDAPTDEEIAKILSFACQTQSAVDWNEYFFIAVRDAAEQEGIIGDAAWKGSTSPGTVTILILADQVADQANHKDQYDAKSLYMQTTMSYFDTGMACGFLNFAAYSLGYSTHYFASAGGKTITPADKSVTYGFGSYTTPNWNISRFLNGKNYIRAWGLPSPPVIHNVEGNSVMIAAVVIGKPNPKADAVSSVTHYGRPNNWVIWQPDSTASPSK